MKFNFISILILLIISIFITIIKSQNMNNYPIDPTGKCEPYIGDKKSVVCSKFLKNLNSIYVSENATQLMAMSKLEEYFGILSAIGGPECKGDSLTYKTLCSTYLPECKIVLNNSTSVSVSIQERVCFDTCVGVTTKCKIPSFYFNCTQNEEFSKLPRFPINETKYDIGGSTDYQLLCYAPLTDNTTVRIDSSYCPKPLLYVNSTDHDADYDRGYLFVSEESNCVVPNPVPIYTEKQWDNIYNLSSTLAVLSCVGTLYLLITFIVLNPKITRFDKMYAYFNGSVFMMSLSGVILLIAGGPRSLIKEGGARIAVHDDALCVAQGFIFQLFSIMAILYWGYLCFDLWFSVRYINRPLNILKYYIPVVTFISLVLSIVPLSLKNFRMVRGGIHCWIHKAPFQNGIFFIPLATVLTISTGFIVLVVWEIYKIVKATGRGGALKLEIKPILSVVLIYLSFVYIFGFNYYNDNNQANTYGNTEAFFKCTLENEDISQCTINGPNIAATGYFNYCIRIYGVYCFLLQGINSRALKIWKRSIFFNNRFITIFKVKLFSGNSDNSVSVGGNTSTTAGGPSSSINNKLNTLNSGAISSKDSYAFSKNNSSDDEDDDFDPYHKKDQNVQKNDIEIGSINK